MRQGNVYSHSPIPYAERKPTEQETRRRGLSECTAYPNTRGTVPQVAGGARHLLSLETLGEREGEEESLFSTTTRVSDRGKLENTGSRPSGPA